MRPTSIVLVALAALSFSAVACSSSDNSADPGGADTGVDGGPGGDGGGGACTSRGFEATALTAGDTLVDLAVGRSPAASAATRIRSALG